MEYKRYGSTVAVRLEKGDEICASLKKLAAAEGIKCASVTGIGATDDFTVGVFSLEKSEYEKYSFTGNHEITNLTGNLSVMNSEEYVHLHITCAGDGGAIRGGHLLGAVISLTAEIFVDIKDGVIDRKRDEALGINLWSMQ